MIKGNFFGKSLKQLFIISLISCFILLVGSSVNAYYNVGTPVDNFLLCDRNPYGNYSDFPCENTCTINSNLSFSCSSSNNKIIFTNYRNGFQTAYYRTANGLMRYSLNNFGKSFDVSCGSSNFNSSSNDAVRGFLYTGFQLCDGDYYPNTSPNISACPGSGTVLSYTGMLEYIKNSGGIIGFDFNTPAGSVGDVGLAFIGNGFYFQATVYNTYGNLGNQQFRFGNASLDYGNVSNSCTTGDYKVLLSTSFPGIINNPLSLVGGGGVSWIPGTGSRLNGRIIVDSGYTNHDMVKGFECVGLQPALCYGGFDINNIFQPDESFEDFTGYIAGEGATIFEIYNLYSGSFSSLNQFLNTVLSRYQNGQINSFKTEPKALLMLGAQMNTAGFKTSYIASYCNLLLNNDNSNIYTGNSVDDLRVQSCLRSKKTKDSLKNSDGEDILFQTTTGGIFGSGDDIDFNPDTFFSSLMEEITTKLDKNLSGGSVGIIPGYIVIFTLAIIFIRLISH